MKRRPLFVAALVALAALAAPAAQAPPLVRFGVVTDLHYADIVPNATRYTFVSGGVRFVVLDASHRADGTDDDHGNFDWGARRETVAVVKPREQTPGAARLTAGERRGDRGAAQLGPVGAAPISDGAAVVFTVPVAGG